MFSIKSVFYLSTSCCKKGTAFTTVTQLNLYKMLSYRRETALQGVL